MSARQTKTLELEDLAEMLAPGAALAMCNEAEARQLTRCAEVEDALHAMHRLARLAVITRGEHGMIASLEGRIFEQPAWSDPRQAFVDDTGCGDAAFSALTDSLIQGLPLEQALAVAARMAFAAGTAWGATPGLIHAEQIAALEFSR